MKERRVTERRNIAVKAAFPLSVVGERFAFERRLIPSRRINDIAVEEVECIDYISELVKYEKD
jgi:hypothetical protein